MNETYALLAYQGQYALLSNVSVCSLVVCPFGGKCGGLSLTSNSIFSSFSITGNIPNGLQVYPLLAGKLSKFTRN
jgi:hypothetical protein